MRRLGFGVFVTLYAVILTITHGYLALHLFLLPGVPSPLAELGTVALAAMALVLFLRPLGESALGHRAVRGLSWVAFVWMGFSVVLVILFLASDLALGLGKLAAGALGLGWPGEGTLGVAQAGVVGAVGMILGVIGLRLALRAPTVRRIEAPLRGLPSLLDGFRIVQLSDVHIGPLRGRRFAELLVAQVAGLSPDLVAVTGDLVDGAVEHLSGEVAPLGQLRAPHGVFFVTGNHDYFSRADPWIEKVSELGMRVLRNERVVVGHGDDVFELAGVDDRIAHFFGGDHGENLERALAGRDGARPVVLLAHQPLVFDEAVERGVDLQLSGHTHGGQIWPFGYVVRIFTPYVAGHYRRGEAQLYVSRGTGFWGPPLRLFAPAEITEITLRRGLGRPSAARASRESGSPALAENDIDALAPPIALRSPVD